MIAINSDINSYHEPKSAIDSAKLLSSFTRSLRGFFLFLLLPVLPILIVIAIVYYPLILLGLSYAKSISGKLLKTTHIKYKLLDYKETVEFYSKVQKTLDRLRAAGVESKERDIWFLRPINRHMSVIYQNFLEIESILRKAMFIDTSSEEYSDEEKAMFAELSDFFGKDEVYQKDTFHQLKKESA